MARAEAVSALTRNWLRFQQELGQDALSRVHGLVEELDLALDDTTRVRVWTRIIDLALAELSTDSEIRREVDRALTSPRLSGAKPEWRQQLSLIPLARPAAPTRPTWRAVVLAATSVSATSMRQRGDDPDRPGLIRLRGRGQTTLPSFQFTRTGVPRPLVLKINLLLGAETDPWGVADWWLCPNVWLAGTPADLLDRLDDDTLVAAALAAVEG